MANLSSLDPQSGLPRQIDNRLLPLHAATPDHPAHTLGAKEAIMSLQLLGSGGLNRRARKVALVSAVFLMATTLDGALPAKAQEGSGAQSNSYTGLPVGGNVPILRGDDPNSAIRCVQGDKDKRFVAIYAVPSGAVNRWNTSFKTIIQQALYNASGYLDAQADYDPSGVRNRSFEQKLKILCGSDLKPDVKNEVLADTNSQIAAAANPRQRIEELLRAKYASSIEKYIIFYDGQILGQFGDSASCPDEVPLDTNCNNAGPSYAVDFSDATSPDPSWHTFLHEMSHSMGAIQANAPNENSPRHPTTGLSTGEKGHCRDDHDVMCYNEAAPALSTYASTDPRSCLQVLPPSGAGPAPLGYYDCRKDDYFNPAPAPLSYLALKWNLAGDYNQFIWHGGERVSTGSSADGASGEVSSSANGTYLAFESEATNLVSGDTNGATDIFLRRFGKTTRVSLRDGGYSQANGASYDPSLSPDDRWLVFSSDATNLVSGDTNAVTDVFVRDRNNATTKRVSITNTGGQAPEGGYEPDINRGGRYVAFVSEAALVAEDTNGRQDVYVRDTVANTTIRASLATDGTQRVGDSFSPSISDDGRYVAFLSYGALTTEDTNSRMDAYVRDLWSAPPTTRRVSVATTGTEAGVWIEDPKISANGRYVVFEGDVPLVAGDSNGTYDVFVRDLVANPATTLRITTGNAYSGQASVSGDGRYVAFGSSAWNLIGGDDNGRSDVFVYDQTTGQTRKLSQAWDGAAANGHSLRPDVSDDGRYVAFESHASNISSNDANGLPDIFQAFVG